MNNLVNRVAVDQVEIDHDKNNTGRAKLLNPNIREFEGETKMRVRLIAEEAWEKMNCEDIGARFMTQNSLAEGGILMPCTE